MNGKFGDVSNYRRLIETGLVLTQNRSGLGVCGPSGRFKRGLVKKIALKGSEWDDENVSPVLWQTCKFPLHASRLLADSEAY